MQGRLVFERQWLHALALGLLLFGVHPAIRLGAARVGPLWDLGAATWLWIAVLIPVAHQVLVWFCWRTELHLSLLSRLFGDRGFTVYAVLFSMLGIARVVVLFLLAIANRDSVTQYPSILRAMAIMMLIPAARDMEPGDAADQSRDGRVRIFPPPLVTVATSRPVEFLTPRPGLSGS